MSPKQREEEGVHPWVLAPKESEQRLHGVTHLTGRLRGPRAITLDQMPETFNERRRKIRRAATRPPGMYPPAPSSRRRGSADRRCRRAVRPGAAPDRALRTS